MLQDLRANHREIARLTFEGYKPQEISSILGLAQATVYNIVRDPLFKAYVENMQNQADDDVVATRKRLAQMNTKALDTLEKMLDRDPDANIPASVALKAAESVLDRNGYKPPERHEHLHGHFTSEDIKALKARAKAVTKARNIVDI